MNNVEQDFVAVAAQINLKIKEATEALKEVNRLKDEANMPALLCSSWTSEELYGDELKAFTDKVDLIDVSDLETQLNIAGWSTSSSYC